MDLPLTSLRTGALWHASKLTLLVPFAAAQLALAGLVIESDVDVGNGGESIISIGLCDNGAAGLSRHFDINNTSLMRENLLTIASKGGANGDAALASLLSQISMSPKGWIFNVSLLLAPVPPSIAWKSISLHDSDHRVPETIQVPWGADVSIGNFSISNTMAWQLVGGHNVSISITTNSSLLLVTIWPLSKIDGVLMSGSGTSNLTLYGTLARINNALSALLLTTLTAPRQSLASIGTFSSLQLSVAVSSAIVLPPTISYLRIWIAPTICAPRLAIKDALLSPDVGCGLFVFSPRLITAPSLSVNAGVRTRIDGISIENDYNDSNIDNDLAPLTVTLSSDSGTVDMPRERGGGGLGGSLILHASGSLTQIQWMIDGGVYFTPNNFIAVTASSLTVSIDASARCIDIIGVSCGLSSSYSLDFPVSIVPVIPPPQIMPSTSTLLSLSSLSITTRLDDAATLRFSLRLSRGSLRIPIPPGLFIAGIGSYINTNDYWRSTDSPDTLALSTPTLWSSDAVFGTPSLWVTSLTLWGTAQAINETLAGAEYRAIEEANHAIPKDVVVVTAHDGTSVYSGLPFERTYALSSKIVVHGPSRFILFALNKTSSAFFNYEVDTLGGTVPNRLRIGVTSTDQRIRVTLISPPITGVLQYKADPTGSSWLCHPEECAASLAAGALVTATRLGGARLNDLITIEWSVIDMMSSSSSPSSFRNAYVQGFARVTAIDSISLIVNAPRTIQAVEAGIVIVGTLGLSLNSTVGDEEDQIVNVIIATSSASSLIGGPIGGIAQGQCKSSSDTPLFLREWRALSNLNITATTTTTPPTLASESYLSLSRLTTTTTTANPNVDINGQLLTKLCEPNGFLIFVGPLKSVQYAISTSIAYKSPPLIDDGTGSGSLDAVIITAWFNSSTTNAVAATALLRAVAPLK